MSEVELSHSEQERIRREKFEELKAIGRNPFDIVKFNQTHHSEEIKEKFEELDGKDVVIAGRLMTFRDMGKASFIDVQDRQGRIQVYVKEDEIGEEEYKHFKHLDIGDIVGINGYAFRTKRGEISVHAKIVTLLTKALQPLPDKFHGLKDMDTRYRQRYTDMIMNRDVFDTFMNRTKIIKAVREFMDGRDYVEVDTPILAAIASGAAARPFTTHFNALDLDVYLRIATELYLKRCIVGGMERVYEMGKDFRNEGFSIRHNPEFTMIELYQAYADYNDMMELCENLIAFCCMKVHGTTKVNYQGTELEFKAPWRRITMIDAVKEYGKIDFNEIKTVEEARKIAEEHGLVDDLKKELSDSTKGDILIAAFEKYAEGQLIQPTFVIDYPTEISPLTKQKPGDPTMTERFEAFCYAREIANAYSELNDPIIQRDRFEQQANEKALGDDEAYMMDEDFCNSLEVGMPPTGGMGIGIDRIIMFLTNAYSIRDVILFPMMKPEV